MSTQLLSLCKALNLIPSSDSQKLCSKSNYTHFCMYIMSSTFVYDSLLCHFVPSCDVREGNVCVSASVILSICLPLLV